MPGRTAKKVRNAMGREDGFSLIELLIVVGIMLVVAAIAIPSLVRSRMAANEASAAASLKQIGIANTAYLIQYSVGYAGTLLQLGPPSGACATVSSQCADLLDPIVSGVQMSTLTPVKSGYQFSYFAPNANPSFGNPNSTYAVVAVPLTPRSTGQSTFCFDNTISIFKDTSGTISDGDPLGCPPVWPVGGTVNPL